MTEGNAIARFRVDQGLPFRDPLREMGADPSRPVCDCVHRFEGWGQWLCVTAAQSRGVDSAFDGDDGPDTMWGVNRVVLDFPRSDHCKKVLLDEWADMHRNSLLAGEPFRDHQRWD